MIEVARYSIVPGSPAAALQWLLRHAPSGSTNAGSSYAGGPVPADDDASQVFGWPVTQALNSRQLIVTSQAFGKGSLLRIDSQVVYWPDVPAGEHIPTGVDRIVLAVTIATVADSGMKVTTHTDTFVVTQRSEITAFVRAEAALRPPIILVNPGGPCIGVAEGVEHYVARLFVRGDPDAVVILGEQAANTGTGNVTFSSSAKAYPLLQDGGQLLNLVEKLTGEHFTMGCG